MGELIEEQTIEANQKLYGTTPWRWLLVVIVLYLTAGFYGVFRFVYGNWLFIQTGDIEQFTNYNFIHNLGLVTEGLGATLFYYILVKGLLNRVQLFRIFALIESCWKLLFLVAYVYISIVDPIGSYIYKIGAKEVLKVTGLAAILVTGMLSALQILKIYILFRPDTRSLFQKKGA